MSNKPTPKFNTTKSANTRTPAQSNNKRPGLVPADQAADGFLNLFIVDLNGNRYRLPKVTVSLYGGYNRKLDDGMLARAYTYEQELAEYNAAIAADPNAAVKPPVPHEFQLVGTVQLAVETVDPVL